MNVALPFATGEALREQLLGSAALAAEARLLGMSEEATLERLLQIAERAKAHWCARELRERTIICRQ